MKKSNKNLLFLPLLTGGLLVTSLLGMKSNVNVDKELQQHNWYQKITNGSSSYGHIRNARITSTTNDSISFSVEVASQYTDVHWRVRYYNEETLSKIGDADFDSRRYDCEYVASITEVGIQKWTFNSSSPCWEPLFNSMKDQKSYARWINVQAHGSYDGGRTPVNSSPMFSFLAPSIDFDYGDRITQTSYTREGLHEVKLITQIDLNGASSGMKVTFEDSTNGIKEVATAIDNGDGTATAEVNLTNVSTNTSHDFSVSSDSGQTGDRIVFDLPGETITQTSYTRQDKNEVKLIAEIDLNGNNASWLDIAFEDETNGIKEVVTPIDNGDGTATAEVVLTDLETYTYYDFSVSSTSSQNSDNIYFVLFDDFDFIDLNGDQGIVQEREDGVWISWDYFHHNEEMSYMELVTDTGSVYKTWVFEETTTKYFEITNLKPGVTYSNWKLNLYHIGSKQIIDSKILGDFKLA